MKIYIENINTFENRNKVYTTQWRKIYKVIEPDFKKKIDILPDRFIKLCKDNANQAQFVPNIGKINIKRMAMEQGLYVQVVKLRQKDLKFTSANNNNNEAKFKLQFKSDR